MLLQQVNGVWTVTRPVGGASLPPEIIDVKLPEQVSTKPMRFTLSDGQTGVPVFARVSIVDEAETYWPPNGHQKNIRLGWRQDVGGDVFVDGRTFAYVEPVFSAQLPVGNYEILIMKGMEYSLTKVPFSVTDAPSETIEVSLNRWINMAEKSWFAGDTHTHFLSEKTGMIEAQAEDLNVLYVLATKWGQTITDVDKISGRPSRYSTDQNLLVYNQEARHRRLGHTILHGISKPVYPLTWGGTAEGVIGGFDYPPMAHIAEAARDQGGLVTWAHFPAPSLELAVNVALGNIDTIDLFAWGDAFKGVPARFGRPPSPAPADYWYTFLNAGYKLPATAGTDKMLNTQVAGSVRVYSNIAGPLRIESWLESIESGKTFVTTGPMLDLHINGAPIGSELSLKRGDRVTVEASLKAPYELFPVDRFELVVNGKVVRNITNTQKQSDITLSTDLVLSKSSWIAVRAKGDHILPHQVWLGYKGIPVKAHTSPIYVYLDGAPIRDREAARQLTQYVDHAMGWIAEVAKYETEDQRREVLNLFARAKKMYQQRDPHHP